ncbi:MAG: hypothetical protein AVDCRST_MAG30-2647, partial [uncultured Solirubrobacteraceae bacterium]
CRAPSSTSSISTACARARRPSSSPSDPPRTGRGSRRSSTARRPRPSISRPSRTACRRPSIPTGASASRSWRSRCGPGTPTGASRWRTWCRTWPETAPSPTATRSGSASGWRTPRSCRRSRSSRRPRCPRSSSASRSGRTGRSSSSVRTRCMRTRPRGSASTAWRRSGSSTGSPTTSPGRPRCL